jgi:DEAD/DEAH box helicase domain-containing protein
MSIEHLLGRWKTDSSIHDNILSWQSIPARQPETIPFPGDFHPALKYALEENHIYSLYSHQAIAWQEVKQGNNIVVVTGTASGKSFCFNLPVIDHLLRHPEARGLYLYPTKALSYDQKNTLDNYLEKCQVYLNEASSRIRSSSSGINPAVYDGDTPGNNRMNIRKHSRIILSNPDMLHSGVLPHHTRWAEFFQNLRFVVIDEIHIYRGVFGSHVANVLRRLKRILNFYQSSPIFILTSATIANPLTLAEKLVETDFTLIDHDGSARGPRNFLIYNPPVINKNLGLRRSTLSEGIRLVQDLLAEEVQSIIFAKSRPTVEVLLTYLKQSGFSGDANQPETFRGYRSGYLPRQRRAIEEGLRSGKVRVAVSTNALELGIDIGGIDAIVLLGFPGSIAATRQQSGRAGRGLDPSLAILLTGADPLDQYLAHHPEYLFSRTPESALINPDNLLILIDHIRCAIYELPFQSGDRFGNSTGGRIEDILTFLASNGESHQSGNKFFWLSDQYPSQNISLRNSSAQTVVLQVDDPKTGGNPIVIGQIDYASALWMVHPQAIYLHEAQPYYVTQLDLEKYVASLQPFDADYYTEAIRSTDIRLLEKENEAVNENIIHGYGDILVISQVVGYKKIRWRTNENLGYGELTLPSIELQTSGYWIALKEPLVDRLREAGIWNNQSNDYGANWFRQKELARQRDEYQCQICGSKEINRAHDVHHKTPFRSFDSYLIANQLDNLITLCSNCHKKVEMNVRIRSGLAGFAYVMEHLSPLFLMCDIRDIGVHFDPQSAFLDNLPIVILYEGFPAGLGFSQHLFNVHAELIKEAIDLVSHCECEDGCPSCVGPGGENGLGSKQETLAILRAIDL